MIRYQVGQSSMIENKDCIVRALANALDKPYWEVHQFLYRLGRKNRCGTPEPICWKAMLDYGMSVMSPVKRRISHARFIAEHPKGKFVVISRAHAWAIKDGTTFDTWRPGPRVLIRRFGAVSQ